MIVLPEQNILTNTNKRCNEDYGKDKYSFSILSRQLVRAYAHTRQTASPETTAISILKPGKNGKMGRIEGNV